MAEGLRTADGKPVGVQPAGTPDTSAFDAAVAGTSETTTDELAPPTRTKPVPTEDEAREIRKTARKPSGKQAGKPRATSSPAPPARDYTKDLDQLGEALWIGLSQLPFTQSYAPLMNEASRAPMVSAWNAAAQQSPAVRARIDQLVSGSGNSWILGVAIATIPVALGAYQIATNPQLRQAMAQQNAADVHQWAQNMGLLQETPEPQAA